MAPGGTDRDVPHSRLGACPRRVYRLRPFDNVVVDPVLGIASEVGRPENALVVRVIVGKKQSRRGRSVVARQPEPPERAVVEADGQVVVRVEGGAAGIAPPRPRIAEP